MKRTIIAALLFVCSHSYASSVTINFSAMSDHNSGMFDSSGLVGVLTYDTNHLASNSLWNGDYYDPDLVLSLQVTGGGTTYCHEGPIWGPMLFDATSPDLIKIHLEYSSDCSSVEYATIYMQLSDGAVAGGTVQLETSARGWYHAIIDPVTVPAPGTLGLLGLGLSVLGLARRKKS